MGYVVSFEKPLKDGGKVYKTDVEVAQEKRFCNTHAIPTSREYDCYFSCNPSERNRKWEYLDVK